MNSIFVKIGICVVLIVALLMVGLTVFFPQIVAYRHFLIRNQAYYSDVAQACDELLKKATDKPMELLGTNLASLPVVLLKLNPDHVIIQTDLVMIRVGSGMLCYSFVWGPGEDDPSRWRLLVTGPDRQSSRIVFTQIKRPIQAR